MRLRAEGVSKPASLLTRLRGLAAGMRHLGEPEAAAKSGGNGGEGGRRGELIPLDSPIPQGPLLLNGKAGKPGLRTRVDKRVHNGWSALLGFQAPS